MARQVVDVRPARGPGGHRLYPPGADSDCAEHRYCAYDGTEQDRCPKCHALLIPGCEHLIPRARKAGRRTVKER